MSLQASASAFREGILGFVWRQWGQLGVAAGRPRPDPWCQDPEALLVFSLEVARTEPRMFDELLDWLVVNGSTLMMHRMKHLLDADAGCPRAVVEAAIARSPGKAIPRPEALFDSIPPGDEVDPTFRAHGLLRPPFSRSGKSRPVRSGTPVAFAFKLREVFGATARSEALRYLMLRPGYPAGTSEIAEAASLSRYGLQQPLEELARAGIVQKGSRGKRDLIWWLDGDHPLRGLLPPDERLPAWVGWPSVYRGLIMLWRWMLAPAREAESAYMLASGARALMAEATPLLTGQGLAWRPSDPAPHAGVAYLAIFLGDVASLMAALESA